jgi:putative transposase
LEFAPSTYSSANRRPRRARAIRDNLLRVQIALVQNFGVYGAGKVRARRNRNDIPVACSRVEGLMRQMGLQEAVRGETRRNTAPMSVRNGPGISSTASSRSQRRTICQSRI